MITPTTELLKEAIEDTDELIEYVLSSSGDPNLPEWIEDLKQKIHTAYCRLSSPVKQQSDVKDFIASVQAGKLPPIGASKVGIQYVE